MLELKPALLEGKPAFEVRHSKKRKEFYGRRAKSFFHKREEGRRRFEKGWGRGKVWGCS